MNNQGRHLVVEMISSGHQTLNFIGVLPPTLEQRSR